MTESEINAIEAKLRDTDVPARELCDLARRGLKTNGLIAAAYRDAASVFFNAYSITTACIILRSKAEALENKPVSG